MLTYITRRLLQTVIILLGLTFVFFFILHETPGGYCEKYLGEGGAGATIAQQERFQACQVRLGLNDPIPVQYLKWASSVVHGDFGESLSTGEPVADQILARAPATLLLGGIAYLIQEMIALPLGIFAALRRYSFFDSVFTVGTYIGLSMPSFWLAGIIILIFAAGLGWFPPGGIVGDTANIPPFNGPGYWDYFFHHPWHAATDFLSHLVLPAMVLVIGGVAGDSRFMRASMLDVINQDYIRTARAKGLPRRVVIFKHALRNALLPIITNVAIALPSLIGGAIITETIFGWPGMGQLYALALGSLDYPMLQALTLIGAVGVLLGNLLGDITYAIVDPRIRYD
jgi:peptide/nickel transport system permease protein